MRWRRAWLTLRCSGRPSARLNRARLARTLHLAAAMFAVGAMLSLYARGLLTEYRG
ncbi:hypothetical protein LP420_14600 [Massilia sp. B-10]|nr:hypothetical protein LP420_14600 [Massilia sp. B-10]